MNRILRTFYQRNTVTVARELIGAKLMRKIGNHQLAGIITETEAYCFDDDPASHAYRGKKQRNIPMFGPEGCAYIYFIYGNHFCFNVVAREKGIAAGAVLIRAIRPVNGIELMKQHRGKEDLRILANGPGKLTQALQLTTKLNGLDCVESHELWIEKGAPVSVQATPRIGISVAQDKLWRFVAKNSQ